MLWMPGAQGSVFLLEMAQGTERAKGQVSGLPCSLLNLISSTEKWRVTGWG